MGRKEKKMKNTKLQAMIMAGAMAASSLSAMSVFADETTSEAATEAVSATEVDTEGKFVLGVSRGYAGVRLHRSDRA